LEETVFRKFDVKEEVRAIVRELQGKTAIVTGGGRGLGFSISKALSNAGANVAVIYPPFEARPEQQIRELRQAGVRASAYEADVTNKESVHIAFDNIADDFGNLDILVNNAGKMSETLLVDMEEQEWDSIIETDLKSVFLCCKAVLPHMLRNRSGVIINIASQLAYKGGRRLTHYAAAKAGVIAFTKSLALETAADGIRVNAIAPGPLVTDMTRPFMKDENWLKAKEESVAMGRLGTPEEVAPSVVFLASQAASLYTGQTLLPNAGGVML
jgi:3-oxoacyl-[acyl-carrier protein] reductase